MIITIQFDLLIARSPKLFFMVSMEKDEQGHFIGTPPPSFYVLLSIGLSLAAATFICVYWDDSIPAGSGLGMQGIGWRNAGLVWAWALTFFVITDIEKYFVLRMWKIAERDDGGKSMFRNIFSTSWDRDYSSEQKEEEVEHLRESLRKYDVSIGLSSDQSLRATGFSIAMAALAQDTVDDDGRLVTGQDVLLASPTLQSDPHLMRIISQMAYTMAKMQARLDKLEGKQKGKRKLTLK